MTKESLIEELYSLESQIADKVEKWFQYHTAMMVSQRELPGAKAGVVTGDIESLDRCFRLGAEGASAIAAIDTIAVEVLDLIVRRRELIGLLERDSD